jgi:catechol 2,3-dioxygenase-like lactoylglutathione lyase family enzyme
VKLSYIRLLVTDFDACFRFYRDVMGFEVGWGEEGAGYADFKTGSDTGLALFDKAEMSQALGTSELPATAEAQDRFLLIFGVEGKTSMRPLSRCASGVLSSSPSPQTIPNGASAPPTFATPTATS